MSKKIQIFVVTYNDSFVLNNNIKTFFQSNNLKNIDFEFNIINNHSSILIEDEFVNKVRVLNNVLRPDFSKGHLSRNWNQALIGGFKNINNPDANIVITCQDDMLWDQDWVNTIVDIHKTYSFYTCGWGDGLCSYTVDAVKTIGLWDERFCGITYQEADYLLRAQLYNKEKSSINDFHHDRVLNPTCDIAKRPKSKLREHNGRHAYLNFTFELFKKKWGGIDPQNWSNMTTDKSYIECLSENILLYPYFEKDCDMFADVKKHYNF